LKVLVVGGGGREHALCDALRRSPGVDRLWCAPGNPGIAELAECLPDLQAGDLERLGAFAEREAVDLTVVGPEVPLVAGLVDAFRARGRTAFGPTREAAQLEGSKAFAKGLMRRHNIPSAPHRAFEDPEEARAWCRQSETYPLVVKADGLAAGKGVTVCASTREALAAVDEAMEARRFGDAGARIVIEEFLRGEEASVHAVTDGRTLVLLPTSQDHKRVGDGDEGPNTGGMGAYSPAPLAEGPVLDKVVQTILIPTLDALKREGVEYRGTLYAGLMLTRGGPRVLEFNVRFGDPEAEVILPRVRSDFARMLLLAAEGRLEEFEGLEVDPRPAVGVVVASAGYPGAYQAGRPITGLEAAAALPDVRVYHAGTRRRGDEIQTAGGRVLCVTALGDDLAAARDRAYEAVGRIGFDGAFVRSDIAHRALGPREGALREPAGER
jgi:phosphoribosylamine--glycine ligase